MNAQQIAILGLVVVLIGAGVWTLVVGDPEISPEQGRERAREAALRAESRDPAEWRLGALPAIPPPVRAYSTESGARVLVLEEGKGDAPQLGHSIGLRLTGYLLDGTVIADTVVEHLIVGDRRRIVPGLADGILDIRPYERRRILVPNELAYEGRATSTVPAYADLVFDVRWVKFEITDLKQGTGAVARPGRTITVRYVGRLEDGTIFDQTESGETATFEFRKGGLIDGWVYGLDGMRAGGERRLWVPSYMAYGGGRGTGGKIPPWSNLIFVVELLDVQ